jgi:hypothetical protein
MCFDRAEGVDAAYVLDGDVAAYKLGFGKHERLVCCPFQQWAAYVQKAIVAP